MLLLRSLDNGTGFVCLSVHHKVLSQGLTRPLMGPWGPEMDLNNTKKLFLLPSQQISYKSFLSIVEKINTFFSLIQLWR